MTTIIGIDPHKATHTAVAIGCDEAELATVTVRATSQQTDKLLSWAEPFKERTWAIESAGGLGYLLAQQLVDAGEHVLDVPATLASRVRVLGTGRSDKNDPNDARSVAIAALRSPGLRSVYAADHAEVLRLLAKRNRGIGALRTKLVCRLHALIAGLEAGGIAKELNASDADGLLRSFEGSSPAEHTRHQLALELLEDIRHLDHQLSESHKRIKLAVQASGTSVTEVFGIGAVIACSLIGYTGDVSRFTSRDQFAAYNGTAPIEVSSGGRVAHRLSRRGNRQLNHAIHMAAISQIRQTHSEGRAYFERKVAEGKTKREAIRSLKRQISNTVYRHLVLDAQKWGPGGQAGTTRSLRDRLCTLTAGSSAKSLPDPPNLSQSRPSTAGCAPGRWSSTAGWRRSARAAPTSRPGPSSCRSSSANATMPGSTTRRTAPSSSTAS
jgi:transposase